MCNLMLRDVRIASDGRSNFAPNSTGANWESSVCTSIGIDNISQGILRDDGTFRMFSPKNLLSSDEIRIDVVQHKNMCWVVMGDGWWWREAMFVHWLMSFDNVNDFRHIFESGKIVTGSNASNHRGLFSPATFWCFCFSSVGVLFRLRLFLFSCVFFFGVVHWFVVSAVSSSRKISSFAVLAVFDVVKRMRAFISCEAEWVYKIRMHVICLCISRVRSEFRNIRKKTNNILCRCCRRRRHRLRRRCCC